MNASDDSHVAGVEALAAIWGRNSMARTMGPATRWAKKVR